MTDQQQQPPRLCCLVENNQKCTNTAGNAAYNKRIQRNVAQRKVNLFMDTESGHAYICEVHKERIQNLRSKRKHRDSEEENSVEASEAGGNHAEEPSRPTHGLDLIHLPMSTLRRLKRHFHISSSKVNATSKSQLIELVADEIAAMPVVEKEGLTHFILMIKNKRSKFDQRSGARAAVDDSAYSDPGSPEM